MQERDSQPEREEEEEQEEEEEEGLAFKTAAALKGTPYT